MNDKNYKEPNIHNHSTRSPKCESLEPIESFASSSKSRPGFTRIIKASSYSIDGFIAAYKNEAAFRQVFWLNIILFMVLVFASFSMTVKLILLVASFLSLITELINTGIEACIDHTSTNQHPLAKIAKDVGSAAQFLALTLIFVLWSTVLLSVM